MPTLPPNQPVPVKQPQGKIIQIINNSPNFDCICKIFNDNDFNIKIEFGINGGPSTILAQCPAGKFSLNTGQTARIILTNLANPAYTGPYSLVCCNYSGNNQVDAVLI